MNSHDAIELMMLGATTVQFATAILLYGYGRITEIVDGIGEFLEKGHMNDVVALRGLAHQFIGDGCDTTFGAARSEVDHSLCNRCDRCLQLTFCAAITLIDERIDIDTTRCDGCGLCTFFCEAGAIAVKAMR